MKLGADRRRKSKCNDSKIRSILFCLFVFSFLCNCTLRNAHIQLLVFKKNSSLPCEVCASQECCSMGLSCFKSWKHDSTGHKGKTHQHTHTIANLSQTPAVWVSVCCPWVTLVKCWVRVFRFRWWCVCFSVLQTYVSVCFMWLWGVQTVEHERMRGWERRKASRVSD